MKLGILVAIMLLILPIAYADISIKKLQSSYNLGEEISLEVKVSILNLTSDFQGFLKADINCTSYNTNCYKAPFRIAKGDKIAISRLPGLRLFSNMKGKCSVIAILENFEGSFSEAEYSDDFEVTDELHIAIRESNLTVNPGEELVLKASVYNARNDLVGGIINASVSGKEIASSNVPASNFVFKVPIPKDIKSGENDILVSFMDEDKNFAEEIITVEVIPKPSYISIEIDSERYLPGDNVRAEINLRDQANDNMGKEVFVKIMKDKNELFSDIMHGSLTYNINNSLEPGKYKIYASYEKITKEGYFEVGSMLKIVSKLDGQSIIVTNVGNVDYNEETPVTLSSGNENVTISRKIFLKPGALYEIDLSKEVKEGNYLVTLPTGEVIEEVHIDDNRNILKKASDGVVSITGQVIGAGQAAKLSSLLIALLLLGGIIFGIYYMGKQRKPKQEKNI
jgi:hypothetical protein